jgi:superfamily II DNA or RNA helicase
MLAGTTIAEFPPEDLTRAAELITRRLRPADIRVVLKEIDRRRSGTKGIERLVAETENRTRLLHSRLPDEELARFLVDVSGGDLLTSRTLRKVLALRASEGELDQLHDFPYATKARGTSQEALARCVAERNWHPGKRWARHFVSVLGFPEAFAGFSGIHGGPNFEDVQPHVPLKPLTDFQEDLRAQVSDLLHAPQGENRAILTLPTGAGKTRTTVEALIDWWLCPRKGNFILWIAQSDELCEQAIEAFREVWIDRGDRNNVRDSLRLYRVWGARTTVPEEDGIIVSTIDKLRKALVDSESGQLREALTRGGAVGVIVIDEAHRAEAWSYRRVLGALGVEFTGSTQSVTPVLGLTATPLRSQHDETLRLARRFYGRLLRPRNLPEDPAEVLIELRRRGVLANPMHRFLPPNRRVVRLTSAQEEYITEWKDLPSDLLLQLGEEKDRNRQLLDTIVVLDESWPVLFFGCSVQHAQAMAVLLRRRGRESASVTAETKETTRRHLVDAFRCRSIQVLCNYGVLTTGFDAPQVRAVVIARPTASRVLYDQMIGRGMRGPTFGGTDECLVLDVDDNLIHTNGRRLSTVSREYTEYWVNRLDESL